MKLIRFLTGITTGCLISFLPILPQKASAQNFANEQMAICAQLNAGKSVMQLTSEWAQYVESMIAMNRFPPQRRNEAYQLFGSLTVQAVKTYCPAHIRAVYEFAQQAPNYTPSAAGTARLYNEFRRANIRNGLFP